MLNLWETLDLPLGKKEENMYIYRTLQHWYAQSNKCLIPGQDKLSDTGGRLGFIARGIKCDFVLLRWGFVP